MSKLVHCFILLTIYIVFCEGVWPLPTWMQKGDSTLYIDPSSFTVHANITSPLLHNAVNRYLETLFFPFNRTNDIPPNAETLLDLYIQVGDLSEDLQLGIDESYSMYLQEEHSYQAFLTANTIWGAMRGLETFSQLINFDYDNRVYLINQVPFEISDQPRYPWRGLLIDTSRHYLEPCAILRTIDAMSWNKFNTLHWHIIDAEAFPFVVTSFPLLSKDGAYSRHSIYPPAFVNYVVNFAKERGIRVVIEVDMPGHSYSWGKGYPNITAVCPLFETQKDQIALNPTIPFTYDVIHGILEQIETSTIDDCVHLGGDEVQYDCWLDDPSIALWMLENNKTATETADMFYATVASQAAMLKKRTLYWEDIFGYSVLPDSIFEVYSGISQLKNIIRNKGYVINSYGWYLDMQSPLPYETYEWVDTWRVMWSFDPAESANLTKIQERYFLGGEALMWGDQVDGTNIDSRVWPRASAVAERLWTPAIVKDVYAALSRLVDFRCRMARRGIGAGPVNPDFCPLPFDENHDFPGFDQ